MKDPRRLPGGYAKPILLNAAATPSADGTVWVQVAEEGEWRGHPQGPFSLTAEVFEQAIANLRRHPAFTAGPDGYGCTDVIQWDFHHRSEDKADPAIAVQGAPAQGWAQDIETRSGADGKVQLWAKTRWLPLAQQYVREDKYKWASIAIWPDAVDPVTGESIGYYISSIALTNDPFIQGMVPLAAERRPFQLRYLDPYDIPDTTAEAFASLRRLFDLPELSGVPEVAAQLAKLRAYTTGTETPPPGTDPLSLIQQIRCLLQLPLLTDTETIFTQCEQLLANVMTGTNQIPAPMTTGNTMEKNLLKTLAQRFGIPSDEEAVQRAVIIRLEAGDDATTKLKALITALGTEDPDAALQRIVGLLKTAAQLEEAMPELAALKDMKVDSEEKDSEEDVDKAMSAHRIPSNARPALLSMRKGGVALGKGSTEKDFTARAAARKRFLETYPVVPPAQAHLTSQLATYRSPDAPSSSSPLARLQLGSHGQVVSMAPAAAPPSPGDGGGSSMLADIERCDGRNLCEKAMTFFRSQPGGERLGFDALHRKASTTLISMGVK